MSADRQWLVRSAGHGGVLIATNAERWSAATIRYGMAIADRQHVPVAIVSVLSDPPVSEPEPGRIEDLTGLRADAVRQRVSARVTEVTNAGRQVPIYVVHGPVGPAVSRVAETWGASLIVVGLGRPVSRGPAPRQHRLREIVRYARRHVLAVSPATPNAIGRAILTADFGGTSVEADERAISLMTADAPADLVHVVPHCRVAHASRSAWKRVYLSAAGELLEVTKAALPHRTTHPITTRVLDGSAAHVLIDLARREHADLIALGRHPIPLDHSDTAGPVVDAILDAAPCTVLIAPPPTTPS